MIFNERQVFEMSESDKLKKFEKAVYKEADLKANKILENMEEYKNQELSKTKDDELERHFVNMQNQISNIKQQCIRKVSIEELNAKRDVLLKRDEIISRIFSAVEQRLKDFTKSDEYKSYLFESIESQLRHLKADDCEILLRKSDMTFADEIKNKFKISASQDNSIEIGGFILKDLTHGLAYNNTLDDKLYSQKNSFNEISRLSVAE